LPYHILQTKFLKNILSNNKYEYALSGRKSKYSNSDTMYCAVRKVMPNRNYESDYVGSHLNNI